jgi:hypothetical protein
MRQVVQVFLQMLFRRLGPEDLPDSGFLLAVTAVMYVLTQFLLAYVVYGAVPQLFSLVALEIALLVAGTWALLLSAGRADRFSQTLTALLGSGALLTVLALPVCIWSLNSQGIGQAGPSLVLLGIMVWLIMVYGHIFSRSLSRPFGVGLLVAVAYFLLSQVLLNETIRQVT